MPLTRAVAFRERDVVRALNAARKAGMCIWAVEIKPDGTIRTIQGEKLDAATSPVDESIAKLVRLFGS